LRIGVDIRRRENKETDRQKKEEDRNIESRR